MNQGLRLIIVALILIVVGFLVWLAYDAWQESQDVSDDSTQQVTSFESCVAAGNEVVPTLTPPNTCRDSETGITYTEQVDEDEDTTATPETHRYKSEDGVTIELNDWTENMKVTSPLTINGKVPGNWSFEGSFPVELRSSDNSVIARGVAELQDDWMTEEMVPFTARITFDDSDYTAGDAKLVLLKSNPSNLPENDDSLTLDVTLE